jgi:uncharacterized membrane protein
MVNNSLLSALLIVHIGCGFASLACALGAMLSVKGQSRHRLFGQGFLFAMSGIFVTAIPLSIVMSNLFLLLIAIFSYYQALSGWRYAKNRSGAPNALDKTISFIMLLTGLFMLVAGSTKIATQSYQNTVLIVFGILGCMSSLSDFKTYHSHSAVGKQRIAKHLGAMLGATIAAVTAFSVTNLHFLPPLAVWLGPSVLLVPVLRWWRYKVLVSAKAHS